MNRMQEAQLQAMLGEITQAPIARLALRYWWAAIPVGLALWGKIRERQESKKPVKLYHVLADLGVVVGPVATIIGLNEAARRMEERGAFGKDTVIRDAEFTPQEQENAPSQSV